MNDSTRRPAPFLSLKLCVLLACLAFAVTLAISVGKQMSGQAMAVLIGIVCGIAASVPTSTLLVVLLLRREKQKEEEESRRAQKGAYPPVVVIQGGAPQALPMGPQAGYWPAPPPAPALNRQFHIVGGDQSFGEAE